MQPADQTYKVECVVDTWHCYCSFCDLRQTNHTCVLGAVVSSWWRSHAPMLVSKLWKFSQAEVTSCGAQGPPTSAEYRRDFLATLSCVNCPALLLQNISRCLRRQTELGRLANRPRDRPTPPAAHAARDFETLLHFACPPLCTFDVSHFHWACRRGPKWQADISHCDCAEEVVM